MAAYVNAMLLKRPHEKTNEQTNWGQVNENVQKDSTVVVYR